MRLEKIHVRLFFYDFDLTCVLFDLLLLKSTLNTLSQLLTLKLGPEHDADPLPNEDNSISDDHASTDGQSIKINVTNELGESISKE